MAGDEVDQALFGDRQASQLAQLCGVESRGSLDDFRQYKNNKLLKSADKP